MFSRILQMELPEKQSCFLWGARQTGKSSYLGLHFPDSLSYDLLDAQLLIRFTQSPHLLREELLAQPKDKLNLPIIIDEIQKVPELLNEIHLMIEKHQLQFILCGSSARKLKTQATNLLGGRAWIYHFAPLVYPEIPDFDLLRALQHGLLPKHYQSSVEHIHKHLQSYISVYLTDEIRNEGLVRNLAGFARFLEVAGLCANELINMSNIARDCHVNRNTVEGYFQILIDTMLGVFIYPYHQKVRRDLLVAQPKFYFFDVGVANYLAQRVVTELKGDAAGKSLEHYILMELMAYRDLKQKRFKINYWRTKTGLEVDFILGDAQVAIEVKITKQVQIQELSGLVAFSEEHPEAKVIVVSQDPQPRTLMGKNQKVIEVIPWHIFLAQLWSGEVI